MLTNKKLILENNEVTSKEEVITLIAENIVQHESNLDKEEIIKSLLDRENQVSTGFENGIAIPHAKISGLLEPRITVVKTNDINWPSMDGKGTNFIINILVPKDGSDTHLKILAQLTRKLMDEEFVETLKAANTQTIIDVINDIKVEENKQVKQANATGIKVVAVTSCPMGVAHTYMAAESLEKYGAENGFWCKVETQGTVGTENELTSKEIAEANYVILAADRKIELDRFVGKKVIQTGTKVAINKPESLFNDLENAEILENTQQTAKGQNEIMKALMNGVSHMLPLVVIGGLFLGLSLAFGGQPTSDGLVIPEGTFWYTIQNVGLIGFTLMIPILAGYIAYSIGDRSALAPGLIIGWIANNGSFYGSEAASGFLGAIIGGIMVGYFVKYFSRIKVHKNFQSVMPILVIPLVTTFVTSTIFIFLIGQPIAALFTALSNWLAGLPADQMIIIGAILGLMIAVDMGGPVNKTAMLFAIGMIANGQAEFMGINGVAVATPSIGIGLATILRPKYYNEDERSAGIASVMMGCVGITEGAIPFAAAHPKQVFPANLIGAMVGGMIAAFFGVTNVVPHGGIIIAFTGGVNSPLIFVGAILIGALITALIANALMAKEYKKQNK